MGLDFEYDTIIRTGTQLLIARRQRRVDAYIDDVAAHGNDFAGAVFFLLCTAIHIVSRTGVCCNQSSVCGRK